MDVTLEPWNHAGEDAAEAAKQVNLKVSVTRDTSTYRYVSSLPAAMLCEIFDG
jgi:hypothetical protein